MDVLNIKLNSMASESSLPVMGDFMSCLRMMVFISSLVMPSNWVARSARSNEVRRGQIRLDGAKRDRWR